MSVIREKKSTTVCTNSMPKETELPQGADYRGIAGKASLIADKPEVKQDKESQVPASSVLPPETPLTRGI